MHRDRRRDAPSGDEQQRHLAPDPHLLLHHSNRGQGRSQPKSGRLDLKYGSMPGPLRPSERRSERAAIPARGLTLPLVAATPRACDRCLQRRALWLAHGRARVKPGERSVPTRQQPARQSTIPVAPASRLVAQVAPSVASGSGLRLLAAGPVHDSGLPSRPLVSKIAKRVPASWTGRAGGMS